ncbi:DEAD/DEAH box helicase [Nostoc sp. DedQUE07]|uniref:DEAD/DEAH box helicase n=1 Tax=Nostoc sp. DedQUE07 TaxID=3075392 RepID=UPI002AD2F17E|nr:DEAD/DEAH box helicase [Nostoc sp. DedQUE07]MDZ8131864.1 DEAD/DEAH box helicase [Nostoc sp. DedQUE07]
MRQTKKPTLYEDQQKVVDEVLSLIKQEQKRILVYAETGAGKTTIAIELVSYAVKAGMPCLFVVPDEPLIDQTIKTANKFGLKCGVIKSGRKEDRSQKLQVAGIDTLINRKFPLAEIVFADEAHVSYSPTWRKVLEYYWQMGSVVIGLTATPYRTNPKEGLGEIYDCLVKAPQMADLIEMGRLCPFLYFGFPRLDLSRVRKTKGDYDPKDLGVVVDTDLACEQIVDEWEQKASNRKTIAYTVSLDHSDRLQAKFQAKGYNAVCVDGRMETSERTSTYTGFASGGKLDPQILISVDVLEKGFDEPSVSCIIQARPTMSQIKYRQQIGRGSRKSPGKDHCIVLDYAGNAYRFGFVTSKQEVTLDKDKTSSSGTAPIKACPREKSGCGALLHLSIMSCPHCSYQFPAKQKKANYHYSMVAIAPRVPSDNTELDARIAFYSEVAQRSFRKELPPGNAIALFHQKYNASPALDITKGAVFGANPSDNQKNLYRAYLQRQALRSSKDLEWISQYMKLEFG